jgi:hypothetical protein
MLAMEKTRKGNYKALSPLLGVRNREVPLK